MAKITKRRRKLIIQFVEYMISGGAYFWSGYLMFYICDTHLGLDLWWAKQAANVTGWTVNFTLQRYWVFKNPSLKGNMGKVTGRYLIITFVDFIIDYFIVYGLKQIGISPYLGQFASAGFFTFWNYLWYRFWVFPERLPAPKHPARRNLRPRKGRR